MIVYRDEIDTELYLDIFLTHDEMGELENGKLLQHEIGNVNQIVKHIYIGIINPPPMDKNGKKL